MKKLKKIIVLGLAIIGLASCESKKVIEKTNENIAQEDFLFLVPQGKPNPVLSTANERNYDANLSNGSTSVVFEDNFAVK